MNEMLSRSWRMLALRGVIAILFGVLALAWPDLTLQAFAALFAAYALLTGVVLVVGSVKSRKSNEDWWLPLLVGLVSLGAGVVATIHPGLTALVLVLVVGANALITGVLDIATEIRLRKTIRNEGLLILNGVASIAFGVLVFMFPNTGRWRSSGSSAFMRASAASCCWHSHSACAPGPKAPKPKGRRWRKTGGPYRTGACRRPILDYRGEGLDGQSRADGVPAGNPWPIHVRPIIQIMERLHGRIQT